MNGLVFELETLFLFLLTSALGISINFWYSLNNHEWAASEHQRYVALILPPAILTMTMVIASNLALSLGMIGALSIVRFRNPVKSPFELTTLFVYIVIGVSAGVNYHYALLIWLLAIISPLIIFIVNKINTVFKVKNLEDKSKFIAHLKLNCLFEELILTFKGHEHIILSVGRDSSKDNLISLSLIVDNTDDYINIKRKIEQCAKIISEDLQASA
jgi:hypothetical protein